MLRCAATWPVKDVAERNYAAPCPSQWRLDSKHKGICAAPATYDGPCQTRFDFTDYDADMKKAFEGRCKAYFPNSAFSALPVLQPIIRNVRLQHDASGPIGPAHTKFHGAVVPPNGTIYLPSKATRSHPPGPGGPRKHSDVTASHAAATSNHIKKLEEIRKSAADPQLTSLISVSRCRLRAMCPHKNVSTSPGCYWRAFNTRWPRRSSAAVGHFAPPAPRLPLTNPIDKSSAL
ncbi:hypothetical protein Efla_003080 [Eimeria flavescens]